MIRQKKTKTYASARRSKKDNRFTPICIGLLTTNGCFKFCLGRMMSPINFKTQIGQKN